MCDKYAHLKQFDEEFMNKWSIENYLGHDIVKLGENMEAIYLLNIIDKYTQPFKENLSRSVKF